MDWYIDFILNNPSVQDAIRSAKQATDHARMFEDDISYAKQAFDDFQSFGFDGFGLPAFVPNLRKKAKEPSVVVPEKPKLVMPERHVITPKELEIGNVQALLIDENSSAELRQTLTGYLNKKQNKRPPINEQERFELSLAKGYATARSKKGYALKRRYAQGYLRRLVREWKERGMLQNIRSLNT